MSSMVDIQTFNKVLAEKTKLKENLKMLQAAASNAIVEYTTLKKDYSDLMEEADILKQKFIESEDKRLRVETQLKHSTELLTKVSKAARSAVNEFNELKQLYEDEWNRRENLQLEVLKLQSISPTSQIESRRNFISKPRENEVTENEIIKLKSQLSNTIHEFNQFKEMAAKRQDKLEDTIKLELSKLKKRGLVPTQNPKIKHYAMNPISPSENNPLKIPITPNNNINSEQQDNINRKSNQLASPSEGIRSMMNSTSINSRVSSTISDYSHPVQSREFQNLRLMLNSHYSNTESVKTLLNNTTDLEDITMVAEEDDDNTIVKNGTGENKSDKLIETKAKLESNTTGKKIIDRTESQEIVALEAISQALLNTSAETKSLLKMRSDRLTKDFNAVNPLQFSSISPSAKPDSETKNSGTNTYSIDSSATIEPIAPRPRFARNSIQQIEELFEELENELGVKL